jgi:DNA repair protein RadC
VVHLAQELLSNPEGLAGLSHASIEELCIIKGIGVAKAIKLKAALALAHRLAQENCKPVRILTSADAYHFLKKELEEANEERFKVLLLNAKGDVIRTETISVGTLTHAPVHPREVFFHAIRHKAVSIVVAHNHPSGDPTPSREDYATTKLLLDAGQQLMVPLDDHLVIGKGRFISLRDEWLKRGALWPSRSCYA